MEENFNMRKIHAGYVVEFRNGLQAMAMRYNNDNTGPNLLFIDPVCALTYGRETTWDPNTLCRISASREFPTPRDLDIVRVFGYVRKGFPVSGIFKIDNPVGRGRDVIWERKEAVKMTLAQVCEKLGYDVEIVKEGMEDAE